MAVTSAQDDSGAEYQSFVYEGENSETESNEKQTSSVPDSFEPDSLSSNFKEEVSRVVSTSVSSDSSLEAIRSPEITLKEANSPLGISGTIEDELDQSTIEEPDFVEGQDSKVPMSPDDVELSTYMDENLVADAIDPEEVGSNLSATEAVALRNENAISPPEGRQSVGSDHSRGAVEEDEELYNIDVKKLVSSF